MDEQYVKERLQQVKCFLLDMDGTFYLGERIIDGSLDFIRAVKAQRKDFMFLTNNSSKDGQYYVKKLDRMGCHTDERHIFTSGQAAALYINRVHQGERIYLLGNEFLKKEFLRHGINLVDEQPDLVVIGFDTTLNYEKLCRVCHFIRKGVPFIATHPDFNCPTEDGFIPDIGAILAFIEASTGKKPGMIVGKPYEEIVKGILEITGLQKEELAMVGDRLYTDIATGVNHGILSILVLSGETKKEDLEQSSIQPDMIFENLGEVGLLLQP